MIQIESLLPSTGRRYRVSDIRMWSNSLLMEPERTTLAGRVKHEVNCIAVDNKESTYLLAQMTQEAMRPKHVTKFVADDLATNSVGYVQPGTIGAMNAFSGFIVRMACIFIRPSR